MIAPGVVSVHVFAFDSLSFLLSLHFCQYMLGVVIVSGGILCSGREDFANRSRKDYSGELVDPPCRLASDISTVTCRPTLIIILVILINMLMLASVIVLHN
jgi:hypothetical protein